MLLTKRYRERKAATISSFSHGYIGKNSAQQYNNRCAINMGIAMKGSPILQSVLFLFVEDESFVNGPTFYEL